MSCKKCKHAKWQLSEKGNIRASIYGKCLVVVEKPLIPQCMEDKFNREWNWIARGRTIWVRDGKDCKLFESLK